MGHPRLRTNAALRSIVCLQIRRAISETNGGCEGDAAVTQLRDDWGKVRKILENRVLEAEEEANFQKQRADSLENNLIKMKGEYSTLLTDLEAAQEAQLTSESEISRLRCELATYRTEVARLRQAEISKPDESSPEEEVAPLTYLFDARRDQLGFVSIDIVLPQALSETKLISPNWAGPKKKQLAAGAANDAALSKGFFKYQKKPVALPTPSMVPNVNTPTTPISIAPKKAAAAAPSSSSSSSSSTTASQQQQQQQYHHHQQQMYQHAMYQQLYQQQQSQRILR